MEPAGCAIMVGAEGGDIFANAVRETSELEVSVLTEEGCVVGKLRGLD